MNRGEPSSSTTRALRTKGSEAEEDLMWRAKTRSRALITKGSGRIAVLALSAVVSRWSFQEGASASPMCVPGVTFQMISKSWRKRDQ